MTGPAYHGWTHRPKAQGGTDPIPDIASGGIPTAFGSGSNVTVALTSGSVSDIGFRFISWNDDDVFGYAVTSGTAGSKRARYVTVKEEGIYMVHAWASWSVPFSGSEHPFIQTTLYLVDTATADTLTNTAVDAYLDEWQSLVTNEQMVSSEFAHQGLQTKSIFSFDATTFGTTELGVGIGVGADFTGNKSMQANMTISKLDDRIVTLQTIV